MRTTDSNIDSLPPLTGARFLGKEKTTLYSVTLPMLLVVIVSLTVDARLGKEWYIGIIFELRNTVCS